jgi:DNA-binding LacI/PurR family transcriptional regulator
VNLTDETDPAKSVGLLRQYSVDGVIVASSHLPDGFAAAFAAAGMPVVHAFGRAVERPAVDVVAIDNVGAGRMAAEALIARGHGRIGFLGGPERASTTEDRLAGFASAARERGVETVQRFAGAYSFEAGRAAMGQALAEGLRAEAWFCADDVLSMGALAAAREAGLDVPGDLGIIGLNDMEMAGWAGVDLTTIHQPFADIVAASVDLIEGRMGTPDRAPEVRLFPCRLVERRTLRPLP